ncbi:restriction endonuclease PLD domain-containing protein [Tenacibaculum sp. 190524A05c]|uniref:restriction endonuclease PLD domain-containing protein n=1 Tax=Tenacibaculum platacis TaxID=3137852 RepID=UPI0031FAF082
MLIENLYNEILVNPIVDNEVNELYIVSGYASATFLRRHIHEIESLGIEDFRINLIVGMPSKKSDHNAFLQIHEDYENNVKGYYYNGNVPVHSKVYSWLNKENPIFGFSGSANYSQYGFFSNKQVNQMNVDNPAEIKAFYDSLLNNSIYIPDTVVEENVLERIPKIEGSILPGQISWIEADKSVRISFLQANGILPARSGLNWGQREEKRTNRLTGEVTYIQREPDQAYLSIKKDARKEDFLPEKGFTFSMLTDDDKVMDCVVAQDGRKGVQTTDDNSELGRYIRDRLNVPHGTFLTVEHLEEYGRTDFTLIKIDDETFLFDFSVEN